MLHSLRRRLKQFAELEAAGQSLWDATFPPKVRTRIWHALQPLRPQVGNDRQFPFGTARDLIRQQEGLAYLAGDGLRASDDFGMYYENCSNDMFPTVIESIVLTLADNDRYKEGLARQFVSVVNEILAQERIGWELIDGQMVEIHSKELHEAVVEPVLRLLHQADFANAERAYQDALQEVAQGNASDAITDAGTALQEALTTLGCEGNQLGDLIRSARKKGLLAAHDDPMAQAIGRALNWVAADRSQMGDAHHASDASRDDAWLIVHIVGAMIVRLARGTRRE